jgi:hypothetical protein
MASVNETLLVAPCGMNCGICMAYLRTKNHCPGCRLDDKDKPVTRARCKIKNCENLKSGNVKFCFQCEEYPCGNLEHLDKRYRTRYRMSMIENLENIRNSGIREFLKNEKDRWACSKCGSTICVHNRRCSICGKKKR